MLQRLEKLVIVCLLIAAVGGHWFVLQSAGWVGMLVKYSENSTLREAVLKTFDGRHPCKVCKAVEEGKKSENKQELVKLETKLDFALQTSVRLLYPPAFDSPPAVAQIVSTHLRESPPTPPPSPVCG